jgi:hypothetical protein
MGDAWLDSKHLHIFQYVTIKYWLKKGCKEVFSRWSIEQGVRFIPGRTVLHSQDHYGANSNGRQGFYRHIGYDLKHFHFPPSYCHCATLAQEIYSP